MIQLPLIRLNDILGRVTEQCKEILDTDWSTLVDNLLLARFDEAFDNNFCQLPFIEAALLCEDVRLRGPGKQLHRLQALLSATLHEVFYFELALQETAENVDELQVKFGPFP